MKYNEIYKRYVLGNIEKYCDIDSINQIETITFWKLEFWCDFRIDYFSQNSDSYSYEKNVKPYINELLWDVSIANVK